jgi:hypothetical protein
LYGPENDTGHIVHIDEVTLWGKIPDAYHVSRFYLVQDLRYQKLLVLPGTIHIERAYNGYRQLMYLPVKKTYFLSRFFG